jgi:hypothetical protein
MRDPSRGWENMRVGWSPKAEVEGVKPPRSALFFYLGFILPLLWFFGALVRNTTSTSSPRDVEKGVSTDEKAKKWNQQTYETSQRRNKGQPFYSSSLSKTQIVCNSIQNMAGSQPIHVPPLNRNVLANHCLSSYIRTTMTPHHLITQKYDNHTQDLILNTHL